jgi:hypothetical protein
LSQFYVPGPALVYTATAVGSTVPSPLWQFLGFSEAGVQIITSPIQEDISADYAAMMPADVAFLGEEFSASLTLARYNESVLQNIMQWTLNKGLGGATAQYYLGTLMQTESGGYGLFIDSPYRNKTSPDGIKHYSGDMIPCFHAPVAYATDNIDHPISIRVKKPNVRFRGIPSFISAGSPPTPYSGYTLWDTVVPSGIATANPPLG